jgi:hypothetical protein
LQERDERNSLSFEKEGEERESASLQTPKKRSEEEYIEIKAREREDEEDLFKTAVLDVSPLEIEEPCFQEK